MQLRPVGRRRARRSPRARSRCISLSSSSPRGSIPRARSRRSRPIFPGRRRASSESSRAARLADRLDPGLPQPLLRPRPYAGQKAHGERSEEGRLATRADDRDPAGLAAVARHLGYHLAGAHAEGAREARRTLDRHLYGFRERPRLAKALHHLADVEVPLVEAGSLHGRHDLAHRGPDGLRILGSRGRGSAGERRRAGSGGEPRRSSWPSGCRTSAPRSSPSPPPPVHAGRRPRRGAWHGAPDARVPRPPRRTRRDRDAQRSPDDLSRLKE